SASTSARTRCNPLTKAISLYYYRKLGGCQYIRVRMRRTAFSRLPTAFDMALIFPTSTVVIAANRTGLPMPDYRFSIAPMMDWTDRHCRFFHRLMTRRARLYTEMLTTGAIIHGDRALLLGFDAGEHPVALQLAGSNPD